MYREIRNRERARSAGGNSLNVITKALEHSRRRQTNEHGERACKMHAAPEYTELYQTARRLILDSVGTGTNARVERVSR